MTFPANKPSRGVGDRNSIPHSAASRAFPSSEVAQSSAKGTGPAHTQGQVLPAWSVALPLWASDHWLWLVPGSSGSVRYRSGAITKILAAKQAPTLDQIPSTISYSLIVLDCRATRKLPDELWSRLAEMLAPGGLLLVCCLRDKRLPGRMRASTCGLSPSTWHVIEPGQEGNWHLRPASSSMRRLTLELNPPYTTRVWLARILYRWLPQRRTINCLPVWRSRVLG